MECVELETTPEHQALILKEMSATARREVWLDSVDMEEGLAAAVRSSEICCSCFYGGKLGFMYGVRVTNILSNKAYIWMLVTDLLEKYPFVFVQVTMVKCAELLEDFDELTAVTPQVTGRSHKWLEFIGFERGPPVKLSGKLLDYQGAVDFDSFVIRKEMLRRDRLEYLRAA